MTDLIRPLTFSPVPEEHLRVIASWYDVTELVCVIGVRGYFKNFAEAQTGGNIIGKYDDAICIVTPKACHTFLGNTDPSRAMIERAILQVGKYRYMRGIHGITRPKEQQRLAWIQAGPVSIKRFKSEGELGPELKGQWIGCNIHDGSWTTTGSAGCQTVVPDQWKEFDATLFEALKVAAQSQFWYILTA